MRLRRCQGSQEVGQKRTVQFRASCQLRPCTRSPSASPRSHQQAHRQLTHKPCSRVRLPRSLRALSPQHHRLLLHHPVYQARSSDPRRVLKPCGPPQLLTRIRWWSGQQRWVQLRASCTPRQCTRSPSGFPRCTARVPFKRPVPQRLPLCQQNWLVCICGQRRSLTLQRSHLQPNWHTLRRSASSQPRLRLNIAQHGKNRNKQFSDRRLWSVRLFGRMARFHLKLLWGHRTWCKRTRVTTRILARF